MDQSSLSNALTFPGADRLRSVRQALQGEPAAWLFVAKAMLSMYLACGLAMALELPTPSMSMLTVLVVMNSQSGMVMAKSFYRITGTLLGVTASVVIVALFPQQPVLMLAAIALWSGMCAAGALMLRGFRGYTFVLGGYTVAMIVLPVVNNPAAIFDVAVHRFIEVLLGLGVTTLVFDGLFPNQLAGQVKKLAAGNLQYLLTEVRSGLSSQSSPRDQLHLDSARKAAGFDDLLANAVFEGPWLSSISRPLKRSNHYFMQTITRLQAFRRLQLRLQTRLPQAADSLRQLAVPILTRLNADCSDSSRLITDLQQLTPLLESQAGPLRQPLHEDARQAFDTGAALLKQMLKSLIRCLYTLSAARPSHNRRQLPRTRFTRVYDPVLVLITMARTSFVTFSVGLLWIASGWSSGATGLFIVVALSMMLAPLPNPVAAVRLAAAGHTVAPFIALICFSILPSLTTYPLLIIGTAPFLMTMLYIVTRPGWAGFAVPLNFGFMVALNIGHQPSTDYTFFFNEMFAAIAGVSLALGGFMLFPGVNGTPGQFRRFMGFLDDSVRMAATAPLPGLAERIESRNRDISVQMASQLPPGSEHTQPFLQRSLLTQEACYVLLALREDLISPDIAGPQKALISNLISVISRFWQEGDMSAAGHARLDVALALALQDLCHAATRQPLREHLYLLADVLDEQHSLAGRNPHQKEIAVAH